MDDRVGELATILERAESVHATVTEKTGGTDPDWALFYAWWLLTWSDYPALAGRASGLAELTVELARLDREYRAGSRDEPWPSAYARALLSVS